MPSLSLAEKIELAVTPLAAGLAGWLTPRTGLHLAPGELLAGSALLILLPGFFRDLWLLRKARHKPATAPAREARCLCVESALGLTGVLDGIALAGAGLTGTVFVSPAGLAAGIAATMLAGFLLKDFVFEWSPWKIHREEDHAQVIFRWRK